MRSVGSRGWPNEFTFSTSTSLTRRCVTGIRLSSVQPAGEIDSPATEMVGKGNKFLCSEGDVNGDTSVDLVCKVETEQFMIEVGDSTGLLEAETFDGQAIRGEDSIRIVPD